METGKTAEIQEKLLYVTYVTKLSNKKEKINKIGVYIIPPKLPKLPNWDVNNAYIGIVDKDGNNKNEEDQE